MTEALLYQFIQEKQQYLEIIKMNLRKKKMEISRKIYELLSPHLHKMVQLYELMQEELPEKYQEFKAEEEKKNFLLKYAVLRVQVISKIYFFVVTTIELTLASTPLSTTNLGVSGATIFNIASTSNNIFNTAITLTIIESFTAVRLLDQVSLP